MGTFRHAIQVGDPSGARYVTVEALVDTGASFTMAPGALLRELGVAPTRRATFELADGRRAVRQMGQTWVRIDGQEAIRLLVFGDEGEPALLGADTLEGLLLTVDPVRTRLVPTHGLLMTG